MFDTPHDPNSCARCLAPAPGMIAALAAQGEAWTPPALLASMLGAAPRGGHWNGGLSNLRNNNLVERGAGGTLRLVKELRDG
ncbi:hypothetical protein SAMN02745194_03102 [Roseomonas rosea]|uniref:Helix-turn-helix domain-containing protein n=1 Tax=Muricoccus roseus TaxID=198092 RepID=A0A1M6LA74_9PROT|nr:hypothetical protein [Roseomonas rosea]SHJ68108.1 hypothetical protein SAMN02745194_03102 [Roseomonas rosea]